MKFARLKDSQIGIFANSVKIGLTNNPAFPDLPVSLADLSAATDDYWTAHVNSLMGGKLQTAAKKEARVKLISILRDEAHYVQIVAKNKCSVLLSSGFTDTDRNAAPSSLSQPIIKAVLNQYSEQLWLRLKRVPNARNYQVRLKIGDGDWLDGGIHPQARKIVLAGLTPGTIYHGSSPRPGRQHRLQRLEHARHEDGDLKSLRTDIGMAAGIFLLFSFRFSSMMKRQAPFYLSKILGQLLLKKHEHFLHHLLAQSARGLSAPGAGGFARKPCHCWIGNRCW